MESIPESPLYRSNEEEIVIRIFLQFPKKYWRKVRIFSFNDINTKRSIFIVILWERISLYLDCTHSERKV